MRRTLLLTAATTAALLLTPTAALAHASLDVSELPAGSTTDVVMRVPVERQGPGNELVDILAPEGFTVEGCVEDAGWSCSVEQRSEGTVVSFARGDGDQALEQFGLTLTAPDEQGQRVLPTVQAYTDGIQVAWIGEGGDRPAPTVTVGPPDADVVGNTDEVDDAPIGEDQFDDDPPAEEEPETSAPAQPEDAPADDPDVDPGDADASDDAGEVAADDTGDDTSDTADQDDADGGAEDEDGGSLPVLQIVALVVAVALVAAIALRQNGRLGGG